MRIPRRCAHAALLTATLVLAGCASAATTASTNTPASGAATATSASRHVNLMVYSINSDGPDLRAIVTGSVGDYGPAVTVAPDGKADPSHSSQLELRLTRGSFRLSIADLDQRFVSATSHEPIYPATCSDFVSVSAAVPVVSGSGTGAYWGIRGSFTLTATLDEVEAKPCEPDRGFAWQAVVFAGPGIISLG
jgi:hypothetical protein